MADDGTGAARQQDDDGGHGGARPNSTTPPSPSRTPRRQRRAGNTPPSRLSPAGSSTTLSLSPTPPAAMAITGTGSSSSLGTNISSTPTRRTKSVICPICKKDMCHEKALCGHIRWHTQEERLAASIDIARALSSNFVSGRGDEDEGPSKRFKGLPDLNEPPPPEEEE